MEEKEEKIAETTFQKESLLQSGTYADRKDLLDVLLEENKEYTIKEVETLISNFKKGCVS